MKRYSVISEHAPREITDTVPVRYAGSLSIGYLPGFPFALFPRSPLAITMDSVVISSVPVFHSEYIL